MVKRVYIGDEAYKRLKKFAAETSMGLKDALDYIVINSIDENGHRTTGLQVEPEVATIISSIALSVGLSESELIKKMVETIRVLFDERLTLAEALKSIPQIKHILKRKGREGLDLL